MSDNNKDHHNPVPRVFDWPQQLWPKIKVPLHLLLGQLIGWVLRKWLGE